MYRKNIKIFQKYTINLLTFNSDTMQTLERELKYINPSKIDFDNHNPRGEKAESILKDPEFKDLVKSINTYGVLEPLIIKKDKHLEFEYVLIDGERRLRASKSIPLNEVPVIVAQSLADGKILAYQLHMLRKIWSKIAEAKSIKGIVTEFRNQNQNISDKDLQTKIKDITNAPDAKVKELFYLTLYDDKHIEYVLKKEVSISYLIETEKVLIPKLNKNFPSLKFSDNEIRSIIVKKAKTKVIVNEARFLRREKKVDGYQFIDVLDDPQAISIIEEFFSEIKMTVNDVIKKYNLFKNSNIKSKSSKKTETKPENTESADNAEKSTDLKSTNIPSESGANQNTIVDSKKVDNNNDYAQIKLSAIEQTTIKDIQKKFESKGKTFTKEELEYIREALKCLLNGCLKAATLMIWAACISRILDFINRDIAGFNKVSKQMRDTDTSFYKVLCRNFQYNVKDIEEIRQASMDRQVLCYICFKKVINITELDKFKSHYNTRNNCAHPTNLKLTPNEVIAIFENIFEYIFNNSNLN